MLVLGLILCLSITTTHQTTNYLEETSECSRNSTQALMKHLEFFVGTDSFKQLVLRNHVFIDKTLLLREVFKDHTYLTIFYLPPKFSKTTILDMIRTFAEVQLDSNHLVLPREQTFAYNFFALGTIVNENDTVEGTLINPPLISRHAEIIDKHLGQYPSIHLQFIKVRTIDYGCTWGSFRDCLRAEFERNRFLGSRISANESARFKQLCDYFNRTEWDVSSDLAIDLTDTLMFLAEIISKYFQKKPILYVDEYDALLSRFLHNNYLNEQEEQKVLTFFQEFFQTIFRREDIWHRIFLTGTHSVHSNVISLLPMTKAIYHSFDNDLSHFFGFTEADVQTMREHYPRLDDEKIQEMRDRYKGYQMGQNYPIYNPWCVMNFLTTRKFENEWMEENEFKWFSYNLWGINQMRQLWLDLLSDRVEYMARPMEKFSLDDMWTLKNVLNTRLSVEFAPKYSLSLSSKEFNQALMYQVDAGYLTLANYRREDRDTMFSVRATNMEIRKTVFDDMRTSYEGYLQLKVELADDAAVALHQYLFSRQRQQCFKNLTQSFNKLFKQTNELFEGNQSSIDQLVNPIGRHILDYIGLRLRYQHDYKLDRNIANGFVATRLNVSSVVIFNYNQSVQNEDVLNQIDNFTHPWIETGPQAVTSSVTYLVIGVKNRTEISIRRYGAEPPIEIKTTPPPACAVTPKDDRGIMSEKLYKILVNAEKNADIEDDDEEAGTKKPAKTTRVTSLPKTKKSKSRPQQPKVTKALKVSMTNETTAASTKHATKGEEIQTTGQTIKLATFSTITDESKSTSQSILNVIQSLNESSVMTIVTETTKFLEMRTTKHQTDSIKNNSKNMTLFKSTQQSPATKNIPQETKSKPSITKSSESLPKTQTTASTASMETKLTTTITTEPVEQTSSTISILPQTQSPKFDTTSTKSSEAPLTTQTTASTASAETKPTTSITTESVEQIVSTKSTPLETPTPKHNPTSTKSLNNSHTNETEFTKIINSVTKGIDPQTFSNEVKLNQIFTENNIIGMVTFAESSLKEITRVRRFVINEPTSSTAVPLEVTESPNAETKVTNSDTTLMPKDPEQITTITPGQKSSTTVSVSKKTKSTKSIKTSTKETTTPAVITTEKSTESPKSETTVTDSDTTLAPNDPAQITTTTPNQESSTTVPVHKKSKSTKLITTSTKDSTTSAVTTTEKSTKSPKPETKVTDSDTTLALKDPAQLTTITETTITQGQESLTTKSVGKKSKSTKSTTTISTITSEKTSPKPQTKVNNSDTTLAPKDPAQLTTITETTITPGQESSTTKSDGKKSKTTKSTTTSAKNATISTITSEKTESPKPQTKVNNSDTTLAPKDHAQLTTITPGVESSTTELPSTQTSLLNPNEVTAAPADKTTRQSKTKASKSHSKATRPFSNSTFTRKKKGKNFNATAFVRGNSTKFTKFARGKQFANRTTFSRGSTTTQSTTTGTTQDTFFPTRRWTTLPRIRRSRMGSKVSPKSTTISRIKFLKLFFGVRG